MRRDCSYQAASGQRAHRTPTPGGVAWETGLVRELCSALDGILWFGPGWKSMPRILVVDDSEIYRRSVRAILESHTGYEICGEADNGEDAARTRPRIEA